VLREEMANELSRERAQWRTEEVAALRQAGRRRVGTRAPHGGNDGAGLPRRDGVGARPIHAHAVGSAGVFRRQRGKAERPEDAARSAVCSLILCFALILAPRGGTTCV
jgi:hypothetical protein